MKILVTYATRTGSTENVAKLIAVTLRDHGDEVDVRLVGDVRSLSGYDAVVIGSAINDREWLPEAEQFVIHWRKNLTTKKTAIFAVCMTLAMRDGDGYRQRISEWLAPIREMIQPVSEGLFAGRLVISRIPKWSDRLKFRISVWLGVWKEGDHRDPVKIREWAEELRGKLYA